MYQAINHVTASCKYFVTTIEQFINLPQMFVTGYNYK